MKFIQKIKVKIVGKALDKCQDPFEEGRVIVMLNFCVALLVLNIPYTYISFNHFIGHFISAIVQNICLLFVIVGLNKGINLKVVINVFFGNFILQHLYHFTLNNGGLPEQGLLFLILLVLFSFFLYGQTMGWLAFLLMTGLFIIGIYNINSNYSLFQLPAELADPTTEGSAKYMIILPLVMNAYLVGEFVKAQQKAKNRINLQNNELSFKSKEINDSISYAKRIQEAILPSREFVDTHIQNNFIIYHPKDIVAGDFYWAEKVGEKFFIAAADSTGHGVPGAMVSVVCSSALNRTIKEFKLTETGKILDKTRELVLETFEKSTNEIKDGMDISLLCIDPKHKIIFWSGANNPLWYIQDAEMKEIKADKQPIGKSDNPKPFNTHQIEYKENSTFYLFTDGLADQFGGPNGKKFKYKQFSELLIKNSNLSQKQQAEIIEKSFSEWKGDLEQVDDVCVIGIKI